VCAFKATPALSVWIELETLEDSIQQGLTRDARRVGWSAISATSRYRAQRAQHDAAFGASNSTVSCRRSCHVACPVVPRRNSEVRSPTGCFLRVRRWSPEGLRRGLSVTVKNEIVMSANGMLVSAKMWHERYRVTLWSLRRVYSSSSFFHRPQSSIRPAGRPNRGHTGPPPAVPACL